MTAPDPEKGFVAFLRTVLPGVTVGTALTSARPAVVVDLTPGGTTELTGWIDRVRLDLVCYGGAGDNPAVTARSLAAQVRTSVVRGFKAGGQHVARVAADPPYPLVDPVTFEPRFYVAVSASVYASPT